LECSCAGFDAAAAGRAVRDNRLTTLPEALAGAGATAACAACRARLSEILARDDAALVAEGHLTPEEAYSGRPEPLPPAAAGAVPGTKVRTATRSLPLARSAPAPLPAALSRLTPGEKVALIEETLAALRPRLQADGGDCQFVALEDDRVLVRLSGRCVGCQQAGVTTEGIQQRLIERLGQFVRVLPVPPGARQAG